MLPRPQGVGDLPAHLMRQAMRFRDAVKAPMRLVCARPPLPLPNDPPTAPYRAAPLPADTGARWTTLLSAPSVTCFGSSNYGLPREAQVCELASGCPMPQPGSPLSSPACANAVAASEATAVRLLPSGALASHYLSSTGDCYMVVAESDPCCATRRPPPANIPAVDRGGELSWPSAPGVSGAAAKAIANEHGVVPPARSVRRAFGPSSVVRE